MDETPLVDSPETYKPKPKPRKRRKHKKASVALPSRGRMSQRQPPPPPPDPIVRIGLTIKHTVNGQPYGPGIVEVPTSVARGLLENESRNIAEEHGLTQKRAAIILPGNRTLAVHPDTFEGDFAMSMPAAFAQGGAR